MKASVAAMVVPLCSGVVEIVGGCAHRYQFRVIAFIAIFY